MTNLEKLNKFYNNNHHSAAEDAVLYHFLSIAYTVERDAAERAAQLYYDFLDGDDYVPVNEIEGGLGAALRALIGLEIYQRYAGEDPVYQKTSTLIKTLNYLCKRIDLWVDPTFDREEAVDFWNKNSIGDYTPVEFPPMTEEEIQKFEKEKLDRENRVQISKGLRPFRR